MVAANPGSSSVDITLDGRSPAVSAYLKDIIIAGISVGAAVNLAMRRLSEGDRRALYEVLVNYNIKWALDAVHKHLHDALVNHEATVEDVFRVYDRHPGITKVVTVVAGRWQDEIRLARLPANGPPDKHELRQMLGKSLRKRSCVLVLANRTGDGEFSAGGVVCRIPPQAEGAAGVARLRARMNIPGGQTRVWIEYFTKRPSLWVGKNPAAARYLVIEFPPPCNGGENLFVPNKPSEWIDDVVFGDTSMNGDDPEGDEATEDGPHEEVYVCRTLAEVCESVTGHGNVVEVIVEGTGFVHYRSPTVTGDDMSGCIVRQQ